MNRSLIPDFCSVGRKYSSKEHKSSGNEIILINLNHLISQVVLIIQMSNHQEMRSQKNGTASTNRLQTPVQVEKKGERK